MKRIFYVLLLSFAVGKAWASPVHALVDTASVQCSAEVITRGDTIFSTLEALDVACLEINMAAGFVIEGGASYEAQVVDGTPNGRQGASGTESTLSVLSPTAAGLGKFADIPVNYNNGLPQITIPITVVKEGELQLPVALSYHASGVKVEEVAGWVGMNWSLSTGVINRQVIGGPDESYAGNLGHKGQVPQTTYYHTRSGYYSDGGFRPFVSLVCTPANMATPPAQSYRAGDAFLAAALGIKDTEPDLFTFNVAGYTGKFYFDTLHQVQLIPQQDVKILVDFDNTEKQFSAWTLVTPDGTRYHFGENNAFETSRSAVGSDQLVTTGAKLRSSWLLTRVESADRKRNIYLEYTPETVNTHALSAEKFVRDVVPYQGLQSYERVTTTHSEAQRLSKIYSSTTQVLFHANTLREDVHTTLSNAKRLDEIEVKAKNQATCLRYKLGYDYWQSPAAGGGDLPGSGTSDQSDFKRLRLLSLQEFSCDDDLQNKPAYTFSYAAGNLPRRLSYQRDAWGYFNGKSTNNTLIPSSAALSSFVSSNRDADTTLQKRGYLTQITYPTGGFIRFTMQAHTNKGGLRVQRIAEYFSSTDSVVRTFEYSFPLEAFQRQYTQFVPFSSVNRWDAYVQPPSGGAGCPRQGSGVLKTSNFDCLLEKTIVGSHLMGELTALSGAAIGYQQVRVNYFNSGYSLYKYNLSQFTNLYTQFPAFPVLADNALYYVSNGTLAAEEHYNQAGQIQQKTIYDYNNLDPVPLSTAPAIKFAAETCPDCVGSGCDPVRTTVLFNSYNRQTVRQLLLKKTEYRYNMDGTGEMTNATIYAYGNQHEQAIRTAMQNSRGDSLVSETRFVRDLITMSTGTFTGDAYPLFLMRQRNLNAPVEQLTFIKKAGQTESQKKAIAGSYTKFGVISGDINHLKPLTQYSLKAPDAVSITPASVSGGTLTYASAQYEPRMQLSYYAGNGLLESEKAEKGAPIYYTYDTNLLLQTRTDAYGTTQYQTTTYGYDELFGVREIQNPRGISTEFAYDGLGRLKNIKDLPGNIVKAYEYQYYSNPALPVNAVSELTPRVASGSLPGGYGNLQTTTGYLDGLGRSLQTVGKEAGPNGTVDIVVGAQTYDATGRPKYTYVPFPATAGGSLAALPGTVHGDSAPYTENSLFDDSPLKRVTKAYGPGQAWRTADKAMLISDGTAGSEVHNYVVNASGAGNSGNYAAATLMKKTTTNERGLNTVEFTDKNGQVVERWTPDTTGGNYLITSYIYDDLGRLRYVLPPKLQPSTGSYTFTESDGDFIEGLYGYKYDRRGRVTEKHIPGADWEYLVYDVLDRPVLRQNARQRLTNRWSFTKYDALGRIVQTGETTIDSFTRSTLQDQFDTNITTPYEVAVGGNQSFPITLTVNDLQTETYYDTYTSLPGGYTYSGGYITPHISARGLATSGRVRNPITNDWLYSAAYYDYKDRVVQQHRQNHLGAGPTYGIDRTDFDYTFTGEVTKQRTTYRRTGSADLVILHEYEYDHVGRKTAFFYTYGSQPRQQFARYEYDPVGRLKAKILKPVTGTATAPTITRTATPPMNTEDIASESVTLLPNFSVAPSTGMFYSARIAAVEGLQRMEYSYHIRDYLQGINLDGSGNASLAGGRLFAMKLDYEADGTYYDGNIRKQTWLGANDGLSRSYTYRYDLANRLTSAAFAGGQTGENYSLETVSFDKNGNLYKLWRRGKTGSSSFGYVDQLAYTYQSTTSNKISQVTDAIANANDVEMFKDVSGTDYTYWNNGALKSDNNKGVSQIQYNHLELTKRIEFSSGKWIDYHYDGAGSKLRKITSDGVKTDYVGAVIYQNDTLYQVANDEGRYSSLGFEFSYSDHLGNVRLMFKDSSGVAAITQTENFGAWGESLKSLNYYRKSTGKDQFVFTGHERDEDLGVYDAKARMYDPLVPRFWAQDMLSELSRRFSPYVYTYSNPINFIDPDGMVGRKIKDFDGNEHEISDGDVTNIYTSSDDGDEKEKNKTKTPARMSDEKEPKFDTHDPLNHVILFMDQREEDDKTRYIDDFFAFFNPFKSLEGFLLLAKLNPFSRAQAVSHLLKNTLPVSIDGKLLGEISGGKIIMNNHTLAQGKFDFVIMPNGQLLLGRKHTFLSGGADVLAAGELKIRGGSIVGINNLSGHYAPGFSVSSNYLNIFKNLGVNVSKAHLQIFNSEGQIIKHVLPK